MHSIFPKCLQIAQLCSPKTMHNFVYACQSLTFKVELWQLILIPSALPLKYLEMVSIKSVQ